MYGTSISQWANQSAKKGNIPLSALLELTYVCNQGCYYCYNRAAKPKSELSTNQWIAVLDQLGSMGTLYITLSGGEPFCRKDIREILFAAVSRSFAVSLISNGTFIDSETAVFLSELGILEVGVSFHAMEKSLHDRLAALDGSFFLALRALRVLTAQGIRTVVKHTVTKENFGQYEPLSRMAEEEGAGFEADSIVFPKDQQSTSGVGISKEQHQVFLEYMGIKPLASPDSSNLHCDAGRSVMGINPFGDIFPCVQLPVVFGNVLKEPIKDIWRAASARGFRFQEEKEAAECSNCITRSLCARCPGLSLMETGKWQGGAPSVCTRADVLCTMSNPKPTIIGAKHEGR